MNKIVTAEEMARVEAWAVAHGASTEAFMEEAGRKVAIQIQKILPKGKKIAVLLGKGNKGGDGYVAARHLQEMGYLVELYPMYPSCECSRLNQQKGALVKGVSAHDFTKVDLILDALLGTGYHGALTPELENVVRRVNESQKPIVAIDIPSGLNGSTGKIETRAIMASHTIALGFAKVGFFIGDAWKYVGTLHVERFGFSQEVENEAKAIAYIPDFKSMSLPPIKRTQNKYSRGFVVGFGGSKHLSGAIKLSAKAALHTGAGIVKLFGLEEIGQIADELIFQLFDEKMWNEALQKAQVVFIGPGMGRSDEAKMWLERHLPAIQQPCVLDADALFFLPKISQLPTRAIVTPHQGEMNRLLAGQAKLDDAAFLQQCNKFAMEKNVIVVLKGSPTWIFAPDKMPAVIPLGDPGMATAGSGDVLTGMIAALLAQGKSLYDAALLGVVIHALAGEAAARDKTSYGYTASDLIEHLPDVYRSFPLSKEGSCAL